MCKPLTHTTREDFTCYLNHMSAKDLALLCIVIHNTGDTLLTREKGVVLLHRLKLLHQCAPVTTVITCHHILTARSNTSALKMALNAVVWTANFIKLKQLKSKTSSELCE